MIDFYTDTSAWWRDLKNTKVIEPPKMICAMHYWVVKDGITYCVICKQTQVVEKC